MSWIRLDDQFADHPKIVAAGPLAGWLHVKAMLYCGRYLTDGHIPKAIIPSMVDWETWGVSTLVASGTFSDSHEKPSNLELAEQLVRAGAWVRTDTGFQVHDYLDYQPSRAQVLAERKATKERVERYRNKDGKFGNGVGNGDCNGVTNAFVTTAPYTSPSPSPKKDPEQKKKEIAADKPPPLPFKPEEALSALATASKGRFVVSKLSKGQAINAQRLIREAPALDTWTLAGEWLAAGGDGWKGKLDVRNLGDFATWVAHSKAWAETGRRPITKAKPEQVSLGYRAPIAAQPETRVEKL